MADFTVTLNEEYTNIVNVFAHSVHITPAQFVQLVVEHCMKGSIELIAAGISATDSHDEAMTQVPNTVAHLKRSIKAMQGEASPNA